MCRIGNEGRATSYSVHKGTHTCIHVCTKKSTSVFHMYYGVNGYWAGIDKIGLLVLIMNHPKNIQFQKNTYSLFRWRYSDIYTVNEQCSPKFTLSAQG